MNHSEKCLYKIYLTISKFEHSDSKSNICIQLFGKSSSGLKSFKFPLVNPKNSSKTFQSGQTYLFEIEEAYIGRLKKVVLTNQDSLSSGLHIKNVRIEITKLNKSWNFYCNQWLKTELSLTQDDLEEETRPEKEQWYGNVRYTIKVITSQCSKLDFDPMINIKIVELDVEAIEKIVFYCQNDENNKTIDWYYDSITIDVPSKLTRYLFTIRSKKSNKCNKNIYTIN
ncbi:lipoxygenase homology domain-containing 1-like isoform X1 [Brachionus plicatilis]|uniref:Lipoxygenase homology domain-containing 1-like isoform X1 n=1 Tax=Brachionus plicatilis TaxID=10195 RepID=A0A3M7S911_BRAPC|nr:lipoxygenase homology domain-containing 1-like isoform X1 [Brachionus plicatilis]